MKLMFDSQEILAIVTAKAQEMLPGMKMNTFTWHGEGQPMIVCELSNTDAKVIAPKTPEKVVEEADKAIAGVQEAIKSEPVKVQKPIVKEPVQEVEEVSEPEQTEVVIGEEPKPAKSLFASLSKK